MPPISLPEAGRYESHGIGRKEFKIKRLLDALP